MPAPFIYFDEETLWRGQHGAGPIAGAVRTAGEKKTRDTILSAAAPFRDAKTGSYRFNNTFRYVLARVEKQP